MTSTNLTRAEAETRASLISNVHYSITLDLRDGANQQQRTFPSTTTVTFTSGAGETFIDLRAAVVHKVELDGQDITTSAVPLRDGTYDETRGIQLQLTAGTHELTITADAVYSSTGQGLHRFVDPADNETYMYTQFETADAKRVFACFDQPDIKATYAVAVTTPEAWTVVTNNTTQVQTAVGNSAADTAGNSTTGTSTATHTAVVDYPLSTYLIAFCVGPWFSVQDSWIGTITEHPETAGAHAGSDAGSDAVPQVAQTSKPNLQTSGSITIPLGLYCRQSLAQYMDAEELFTITKQGFDWYAANFGVAYPFHKYDQVFCPEFNMGAMENAGAVTFRDEYIFRSQASHYQYERRADTVLHEMAHMWFGDLVTMRWWDDLWLNESFATWASAAAQAEATKFRTAWVTFANKEKAWAYGQDQLSSTHPVFSDASDILTVEANFDGITYAKGASVLKQLAAYVGIDAFMAGIRAHFMDHGWDNATFDQLLANLEKHSGRDLSDWANQWLKTTGINTLAAATTTANGKYDSFSITQTGAAPGAGETRTHRIAVGLYNEQDGQLIRTQRVELDIAGPRTEIPELVGVEQADLILVNDDDLTYALIELDERSLASIHKGVHRIADPMARSLVWSATWQMTRNAQMRARDFVDLVARGAHAETEMAVLEQILLQARTAVATYVAPEAKAASWNTLRTALLEGATTTTGAAQLAFFRAFAACPLDDAATTLLHQLLAGTTTIDGLNIDQDLRWAILIALSGAGEQVEETIAAELERDNSSGGAMLALQARSAAPDAKARVWDDIVERGHTLSNLELRHRIAGFTHVGHGALLQPYAAKFVDVVETLWRNLTSEMALPTTQGLYPTWDHSEATDAAIAEIIARSDKESGWRRPLMEGRDAVARAKAAIARDAQA